MVAHQRPERVTANFRTPAPSRSETNMAEGGPAIECPYSAGWPIAFWVLALPNETWRCGRGSLSTSSRLAPDSKKASLKSWPSRLCPVSGARGLAARRLQEPWNRDSKRTGQFQVGQPAQRTSSSCRWVFRLLWRRPERGAPNGVQGLEHPTTDFDQVVRMDRHGAAIVAVVITQWRQPR